MIIAFEGADKVGKSTAITETQILLTKRGYTSTIIKPKFIPNKIKELEATDLFKYNDDVEALLYLAHFVSNELSLIIPATKQYDFVLLDRYIDSCYIFNVEMLNTKKEYSLYEEVFSAYMKYATKPDITILLTASPEEIEKRLITISGTTRFENLKNIKEIQSNFLKIKALNEDSRYYVHLDTTETTKELVAQYVVASINNYKMERKLGGGYV